MRLNPDKCVFGVEGRKFLDFMLTHRGIEANPEKCMTITEMRSPENTKEIQKLIGRLMTLSRFVAKLLKRTNPIVQLLRKTAKFKWTPEVEEIFLHLKAFLATPPVIKILDAQQPIIVYLEVSEEAVNVTLVQVVEKEERPIYFISQVLHDVGVRYQMIEKVVLTLIITARRIQMYFQNHHIVVKADYPIMKILAKADLAGQMIGWAIELSKFPH